MAKMRVHELAKELEIKSQEIIDSLSRIPESEIKSASNNIDDAAQEIIRRKVQKIRTKGRRKTCRRRKAEKNQLHQRQRRKAGPEEKKPADAQH